jgi:hypothetical protein
VLRLLGRRWPQWAQVLYQSDTNALDGQPPTHVTNLTAEDMTFGDLCRTVAADRDLTLCIRTDIMIRYRYLSHVR